MMQTQTHAELTGEIPHVGFHADGSKQPSWYLSSLLSRPLFPTATALNPQTELSRCLKSVRGVQGEKRAG